MENLLYNKDKSNISFYDTIQFFVNSIWFYAQSFVQFEHSSSGIKNHVFRLTIQVWEEKRRKCELYEFAYVSVHLLFR